MWNMILYHPVIFSTIIYVLWGKDEGQLKAEVSFTGVAVFPWRRQWKSIDPE